MLGQTPTHRLQIRTQSAGDRILQGRALDVFDAEVLGCGRRLAATITLTEPVGVVFDSTTNDPVAGAVVTLLAATAGQCSASPVALEGNPATTDANGRFAFPAVPGEWYCLAVSPPNGYTAPSKGPYDQLVPGRNLAVSGPTSGGSYGQPFRAETAGIAVDVPVDPAAQSGLFVQKEASRQVVALGGFVDCAVRVRNGTGNALDRASPSRAGTGRAGASSPGTTSRNWRGASDQGTPRFRVPLYAVPGDLVAVDLAPFVELGILPEEMRRRSLRGKLDGRLLVPYDDRERIADRNSLAGRAEPLAWVDSAVDLFFLQIQGSGRIRLEDGSVLRVNYADPNGRPYVSIGKLLLERIPRERMSLPALKAHLREHPGEASRLMNANPPFTLRSLPHSVLPRR